MGLIRTLVQYGHQAYDELKPPKANKLLNQPNKTTDEVNYPQIRLSGRQPEVARPKVELKEFKQQIGQDAANIQGMLRQKLAEYNLPHYTRLAVLRDEAGHFKIDGNIKADTARKIEFDLNQNPEFKQQFLRLEQHQPTLDYLQNIMRINSTYGGDNQVLNSLLSSNPDNNSLQAISQRFDRLHRTTQSDTANEIKTAEPAPASSFSIAV